MTVVAERDVCELLPWDSEFFGVGIARMRPSAPREDEFETARRWCRAMNVGCLYFLCDSEQVESIRLAGRHGYDLVDVRVTLSQSLPAKPVASARNGDAAPRVASSTDLPALQDLAGRSFGQTRYYTDEHFARERVDALYRRWVERDLETPGRMVLVVDGPDGIAGFASGAIEPGGDGRVGLVAVDERARGRGVAPRLVGALLEWFYDRLATRASVVTQGRNAAAVRLYESLGFRTTAIQIWFHRWFDTRDPL